LYFSKNEIAGIIALIIKGYFALSGVALFATKTKRYERKFFIVSFVVGRCASTTTLKNTIHPLSAMENKNPSHVPDGYLSIVAEVASTIDGTDLS
jgi:hypothetical protein